MFDVVGNGANDSPIQIGATAVKVGIVGDVTVIVIVVVVAQTPAVGIKVYVVVAVLLIAGDHVPTTLLFEVSGKAAKTSPLQIGATAVNVGVTFESTVIDNVVVVAH